MQAGRVPDQCDILVAWSAEHVLVFRPALGKRIKAEFAYDDRKGVGAYFLEPSGLEREGRVSGGRPVFRAAEKADKPGTQCHTSATSLRKQHWHTWLVCSAL